MRQFVLQENQNDEFIIDEVANILKKRSGGELEGEPKPNKQIKK